MINGVINVYKEKGFTSHDVVAKLRGILGQKKIGHTGTLDPDAEGVLPVCLGKATRLCGLLTEKDKTYEAVLLLGKTTDTQDVSGTVLSEGEWETLSEEAVREAVLSFQGAYEQMPPMYSALKVGGRKLCDLAREGIVVERKARPVTIHEIRVTDICLPRVSMTVSCSKGTYIRTLCQDIGEKLSCGGCMESLLRTKVERFELADSHTLSAVAAAKADGTLSKWIVRVDEMFGQYEALQVTEGYEKAALNGSPIPFQEVHKDRLKRELSDNETYRVYDRQQVFIGLYRYEETEKSLRLIRMFWDGEKKA